MSESTAESTPSRTRLLVVVDEWCGAVVDAIVRRLVSQADMDIRLKVLPGASMPPTGSWLDRVYDALDARVFGRTGPDTFGPTVEPETADLGSLLREFAPAAVVDLSGTLVPAADLPDAALVTIRFDGESAGMLPRVVRRRLGTPHGAVELRVQAQTRGSKREVFSGSCFMDHRSATRSVDLIVCKLPMILQAGLCRLAGPPGSEAVPATEAAPVGLGAGRLLWRLAGSIGRRLQWRDQWRMLVYRDRAEDCLDAPWVRLAPGADAFWADPFLVPHERGVAVFFEELPFDTGRGRISVIDIDLEGKFGVPAVVLDKPWHLSYPFVFEWEGKRYMIPESAANETVDLYECTGFPQHWRHVKTLISGVRLADASLVRWQGRWWMFAAHGHKGASNYDELHLYWADDLLGPWSPHLLNPVKMDAGSSRPAGAMVVDGDRIIRPTQDCRNRYGDGVVFQEVIALDTAHFQERTLHRLSPRGLAPGEAFHTYNQSGRYSVIDAARSIRRW